MQTTTATTPHATNTNSRRRRARRGGGGGGLPPLSTMVLFGLTAVTATSATTCIPSACPCFVTGAAAAAATASRSTASSVLSSSTVSWTHPRTRRRGLSTCFLGMGGGGKQQQQQQQQQQDEEAATTAQPSAGSNTNPTTRRVFVNTPHHHGNSHLEGLLDLAGNNKKEEFVAAVVDLEHHMQLEVAEALIFNIRKYTNGGMLPSADGSSPKLGPEQRELVMEYIPEVMRIVDRLEEKGHHHEDARVALYATEALSYDVSVKSVISAGPQLARIFKNIDMMVAKHPELKGGAPFIIQGMMFLNAPMPVRSVKKAKECFQSAHKIDPASPRNNYFCGVTAFLQKDYREAYDYFATALKLSQEVAAAVDANVAAIGTEGEGEGEGGSEKEARRNEGKKAAAQKEMPMDEYLAQQCQLGMDLARSRMK